MLRGFHSHYFPDLSAAVKEAESRTQADLLIAVEPWSGNYRDVDFGVGVGLGILGLLALLYSPWIYPEWVVPVDLLLFFAAGAWLSHSLPPVRRLFTTSNRRRSQVQTEAAVDFLEQRVWTTHARSGILIYVSLLEREVLVLPDVGITAAVPPDAWTAAVGRLERIGSDPDPARSLIAAIGELGETLAAALPASAASPHELPDTPVSHSFRG